MIALSLDEIAGATGGEVVGGDGALGVDAIATDSRDLPAGAALFVALRGEAADGHDHVAAARSGGVVAALVERRVDDGTAVVVPDTWRALRALAGEVRRRVAPQTVAITGSVGKTTVKDLTTAAVAAARRVVAATGSFNNELGVPLTLLGLREDTQVLVAELGARHVGDIAALAPIVAPDVAVVTAVAGVHLEVFGSIDAVARAKAELVEALGPGGMAVLNTADPRVAAMAPRAPAVLTVGGPSADLTATDVQLDEQARARFTARTPWGTTPVRVPVAGRHQVGNALLALAVAGHLGVDIDAASAALPAATVSPWRGEVRTHGAVTVLNDAYNANPLAVTAALDTLTELARRRGGRAVAVLGVMAEIGPTHDDAHRDVGRHAADVAHLVVVGADASAIAEGARDAGADAVEVDDADAAIAHLRQVLAPGDVVLVKASRVAGLERVAVALVDEPLPASGGRA